MFKWKYPLWYSHDVYMKNRVLFDMARAEIWYTENITAEDTIIEAPKIFRRTEKINLKNVTFTNAAETLWSCNHVSMENVTAKGDYFSMNSSNMKISNLNLVGNYSFDSAKNVRYGTQS